PAGYSFYSNLGVTTDTYLINLRHICAAPRGRIELASLKKTPICGTNVPQSRAGLVELIEACRSAAAVFPSPSAVEKMPRASGLNGVSPEASKAIDEELRTLAFGYCVQYWEGEDFRGCEVNKDAGKLITKLARLTAKTDFANVFQYLSRETVWSDAHGRDVEDIQLDSKRTLLQDRPKAQEQIPVRRHTQIAFVDLVKALDTADHKLLIEILSRYGAPPHLCKVIEQMYTDLTVVLKIDKSVEEILQEDGVRQGDNMAPVLFLLLMHAFVDSLEAIWESKGPEKVQVVRASDEDFENGIGNVRGHTPKQFPSSKLDISPIGCEVIYDHFTSFGLEMHIGRTVNKLRASRAWGADFQNLTMIRGQARETGRAEETEMVGSSIEDHRTIDLDRVLGFEKSAPQGLAHAAYGKETTSKTECVCLILWSLGEMAWLECDKSAPKGRYIFATLDKYFELDKNWGKRQP
ncbi:hypothetical protein THAOC_00245, partial [Thalassiosira oceanica]